MIRIESKGLIEANFFFAFWFGIVVITTYLLSQIVGGDRPDAETVMRGCIYIAVNLILWIVSFRHGKNHLMAFVVGFALFIPVLGQLISREVNDVSVNGTELYFFSYVGFSYIAFAWLEWKSWFGSRVSEPDSLGGSDFL